MEERLATTQNEDIIPESSQRSPITPRKIHEKRASITEGMHIYSITRNFKKFHSSDNRKPSASIPKNEITFDYMVQLT